MNSIQNQIRAYERNIIENAELVELVDQEINEEVNEEVNEKVNEKEADEKEDEKS